MYPKVPSDTLNHNFVSSFLSNLSDSADHFQYSSCQKCTDSKKIQAFTSLHVLPYWYRFNLQ